MKFKSATYILDQVSLEALVDFDCITVNFCLSASINLALYTSFWLSTSLSGIIKYAAIISVVIHYINMSLGALSL